MFKIKLLLLSTFQLATLYHNLASQFSAKLVR